LSSQDQQRQEKIKLNFGWKTPKGRVVEKGDVETLQGLQHEKMYPEMIKSLASRLECHIDSECNDVHGIKTKKASYKMSTVIQWAREKIGGENIPAQHKEKINSGAGESP
jgi:hypothetical protein